MAKARKVKAPKRRTVTPIERHRRDEIQIANRVVRLNQQLAKLARRARQTSRAAADQARAMVEDFAERLNLAVIPREDYARLIDSVKTLEDRNLELAELVSAADRQSAAGGE